MKNSQQGAAAPHIVEIAGDAFIREPECKRLTGLSRATRWRMERAGRFPRSRQLSLNAKGWLLSEIQAWIAERTKAA